ncbi:MAG: hypothetical protein ACI38Q_06455 [Candidatus Bruticola sp.]
MVDYDHIRKNLSITKDIHYITSPDYLVIEHREFRGRGFRKFLHMIRTFLAVVAFSALFGSVLYIWKDAGTLELTIAATVILTIVILFAVDSTDNGDCDLALIFSRTGLTIMEFYDSGWPINGTNIIKYYPAFSQDDCCGEMPWSRFLGYSIVHHEVSGTISIRLWLVDENDRHYYDKLSRKDRCRLAVEFFLNPVDNRYIKIGSSNTTEFKAGVKALQEHVPFCSELRVRD